MLACSLPLARVDSREGQNAELEGAILCFVCGASRLCNQVVIKQETFLRSL